MLSDRFFIHGIVRLFCSVIIVCLISSCANLTSMEKSIDTLTSEANEGDLNAAHALCFRFSNGVGAEIDDDAAFNWCHRASSTQNPKSMTLLGIFIIMVVAPSKITIKQPSCIILPPSVASIKPC